MAELVTIRHGEAVREVLERALTRADGCDDVLVIMQRREGGLLWDGRADSTLAAVHFMAATMAAEFIDLSRRAR